MKFRIVCSCGNTFRRKYPCDPRTQLPWRCPRYRRRGNHQTRCVDLFEFLALLRADSPLMRFVDRYHVATPNETVRADAERLARRLKLSFAVDRFVAAALERHEENRRLYADVMAGNL